LLKAKGAILIQFKPIGLTRNSILLTYSASLQPGQGKSTDARAK
jgi:hypothetical protein